MRRNITGGPLKNWNVKKVEDDWAHFSIVTWTNVNTVIMDSWWAELPGCDLHGGLFWLTFMAGCHPRAQGSLNPLFSLSFIQTTSTSCIHKRTLACTHLGLFFQCWEREPESVITSHASSSVRLHMCSDAFSYATMSQKVFAHDVTVRSCSASSRQRARNL